jgi:hypothetical protein
LHSRSKVVGLKGGSTISKVVGLNSGGGNIGGGGDAGTTSTAIASTNAASTISTAWDQGY